MLTACLGGGSSEPTKYYTIAVENISMPSAETYADKRLQVRKFTIEPAYQRANIVAIEEVDEGSSQYARLAVQLTFRKTESDEALWEKSFDQKMSMGDREPRTTAETVSKLYGKIMEEAIQEIANSNR